MPWRRRVDFPVASMRNPRVNPRSSSSVRFSPRTTTALPMNCTLAEVLRAKAASLDEAGHPREELGVRDAGTQSQVRRAMRRDTASGSPRPAPWMTSGDTSSSKSPFRVRHKSSVTC